MISAALWPHERAKFASFGNFSGPTMGPLSIYLPERSDGLLLYRPCSTALRLWYYGGQNDAPETVSEPTGFRVGGR